MLQKEWKNKQTANTVVCTQFIELCMSNKEVQGDFSQ